MDKFDNWDRLMAVVGLLFVASARADAYIDPGTASVIYTVGLAPVLAFLAWIGRRVIRLFLSSKNKQSPEAESDEEAQPKQ